MEHITKISTAAILAGAISLSPIISTAEASAAKSTGTTKASAQHLWTSCTAWRGNFAHFVAAYNVGADGTRSFYRFSWFLGGPGLRNKNNVRLTVSKDPWHRLWEWKSADNVTPGYGYYSPPSSINVPPGKKVYAAAWFTFDRSSLDPECLAETNKV